MIELPKRLGVILDCSLSMEEKFFLVLLHRDADNETCITHPGITKLQEAMGCKRTKIIARLKMLEEIQVISRVRKHRGPYRDEYYINYDHLYMMNRFIRQEREVPRPQEDIYMTPEYTPEEKEEMNRRKNARDELQRKRMAKAFF